MSIGAAFLLHLLVIVVVVAVALVLAFWLVSLLWLAWAALSMKAASDGQPYSTLDLIGQDLSRLDRLDGLGSELR
ncbi:hypothetical protein JTF08_13570 [Micrococcaceae bacterium RIT802]|nr:hypothetical protein [Micrococcaceae bacterium RIT 802]